jgi:hypothetical protein
MPVRGSEFYLKAAAESVDPQVTPGASGYFSAPAECLDPRLFDGDRIRPEVRSFLLDTLYGFWAARYRKPQRWSTVWLAGSGISYQWQADRGNGDLDVLIGIDWPDFFAANPDFRGLSAAEISDRLNAEFHAQLWPKTADWHGFEVTFYVNATATDIRQINPYAAYNLTDDTWTVRPPLVAADPRSAVPADYQKAFEAERGRAETLVGRYRAYKAQADALPPATPAWHNALSGLEMVAREAGDLFDAIHLGRRQAFGPGGSGYGDFYNYRWQAHKAAGTVQALRQIRSVHENARSAQAVDIYGRRLATADEVRTQAALWATSRRGG